MPKFEGVYPDGRGGYYFKARLERDVVTGERRQVTRRGFPTATAAARARRELLEGPAAALALAVPARGAGGRRPADFPETVDGLLDLYLTGIDADQRLSVKTQYDYRRYLALYVRPHLGERKLEELTSETILEWQRKLAKGDPRRSVAGLAPNTIRLARAPLSRALQVAVQRGALLVNPVTGVPRPTPRRSIPRHWSPDEARAFLANQQTDRMYPVWAFLMSAGLRIGELVWLRWPNVDLHRKQARIVEFATRLGWEIVESSGKSASAIRTVDLDDTLVVILREQQELQRLESQKPGYVTTDYVFTKPNGAPFHPAVLSRTLKRRAEAAGLPSLTAHGLRHTSATLMLASGVPPKVAAERLGHADPSLFTNLYSHVTPTMQKEAADKIGQALFG